MTEQLRFRISTLPSLPGVYLMHASGGEIIYVGKAKNLKNRVSSYFLKTDHAPKVEAMIAHIADFEFIITNSESEAFLLENNLIKQYKPRYNILLKDDKTYPSIRITVQEEYPRLELTRRRKPDGSRYFGPYTGSFAVKELVLILLKIFKLPHCKKKFPQEFQKARPCLYHDMGQCDALCTGLISKETHREKINGIIAFLSGHHKKLIVELEEKMQAASARLAFEQAAMLRDEIQGLKALAAKQLVTAADGRNLDVISLSRDDTDAAGMVFHIRGGLLMGSETFTFPRSGALDDSLLMSDFLTQLYEDRELVPEIYVSVAPEDTALLEEEFSRKAGRKVSIVRPIRGEKHELTVLAEKNAAKVLGDYKLSEIAKNSGLSVLDELKKTLMLPTLPLRIESYDISHIAGTDTVGVMIVYEKGKPEKKSYKKFNLPNHAGDTDSMRALLTRRFSHYRQEAQAIADGEQDIDTASFSLLPDLLLMDGGTAQVAVAEEVLQEFDLTIPVYGMVKDDKHRTRAVTDSTGREADILPGSSLFRFLTALQDEVHRFAITFHRQKRIKKLRAGDLTSIPGVGEARKNALLRYFGSLAAIKGKNESEIAACPGIDRKTAQAIFKWFHP